MYPREQDLSHECWLQQREAEIALQSLHEGGMRHFVCGSDGIQIDVTDGVEFRERSTIKRMERARALVGRTDV